MAGAGIAPTVTTGASKLLKHTSASVCGQTQFSGKVIYLPVESQNISTAAKEQAPMKVVIRAKGDQVRWEEFTEN